LKERGKVKRGSGLVDKQTETGINETTLVRLNRKVVIINFA